MYFRTPPVRESTDDAQIDGHIYPVSAMIDGTLLDVLVDNNQVVQAGTVLGHIDPRFYQAALEKARGDLAEAIATGEGIPRRRCRSRRSIRSTQLSGAEAGVTEQNAKIATAQQEVYAAERTADHGAGACSRSAGQCGEGRQRSGAHEASGGEGRNLASAIRRRGGDGGHRSGSGGFGRRAR